MCTRAVVTAASTVSSRMGPSGPDYKGQGSPMCTPVPDMSNQVQVGVRTLPGGGGDKIESCNFSCVLKIKQYFHSYSVLMKKVVTNSLFLFST